jgi:hypothetical protein
MKSDYLASNLRKQVGLEYEDQLIFLKVVEKVSEKNVVCKSRSRKPTGKIVGYSTLTKDSPSNGTPGCFNRRVFIEDPEGVEPSKLFAGVPQRKCL